jgi:hypothetical protein
MVEIVPINDRAATPQPRQHRESEIAWGVSHDDAGVLLSEHV